MTEEDRFSPEIEQTLFRVAQEATNNVLKHSHATRLDVSLSRSDNSLVLELADNGQGFELPVSDRGAFGISGMGERVSQVSGSFNITSAPALGTTVVARVPLDGSPYGAL
jgi:signal transduction histidine kinase